MITPLPVHRQALHGLFKGFLALLAGQPGAGGVWCSARPDASCHMGEGLLCISPGDVPLKSSLRRAKLIDAWLKACVRCRLGSLVQEVEGALQGQTPAITWEEGYSAPLYARVHMRLGMWQWTINSSEARSPEHRDCSCKTRVHQCVHACQTYVQNADADHSGLDSGSAKQRQKAWAESFWHTNPDEQPAHHQTWQ